MIIFRWIARSIDFIDQYSLQYSIPLVFKIPFPKILYNAVL
jgi:hypothetical protein